MSEQVKIKINTQFPSFTFEEGGEFLTLKVKAEEFMPFVLFIRNDAELNFDYLFCLSGVDWKTHLSVVYHFSSNSFRHVIVIKVELTDRDKPNVDSLANLYRTAEFHEREVFDLFGVKFNGHPDLRRLFLTDDWVGYPLRKDYDDPINIIKL